MRSSISATASCGAWTSSALSMVLASTCRPAKSPDFPRLSLPRLIRSAWKVRTCTSRSQIEHGDEDARCGGDPQGLPHLGDGHRLPRLVQHLAPAAARDPPDAGVLP